MRSFILGSFFVFFSISNAQAAGDIDRQFGTNGFVDLNYSQVDTDDSFRVVTVQPDGRILAAGDEGLLLRLLPNGAIDLSFGEDGYAITGMAPITGIALQQDGKIVLVGGRTGLLVHRLTKAGKFDPDF